MYFSENKIGAWLPVAAFLLVLPGTAGAQWIDGTPLIKRHVQARLLPENHSEEIEKGNPGGFAGSPPSHLTFWVFNFEDYFGGGDMTEEEIDCTLRGEGGRSYFYVEDAEWSNGNVTQDLIDDFVELFENSTPSPVDPGKGIFEINSEHFGSFPEEKDIDGDPAIYLLLFDIEDGYHQSGDPYIGGYFSDVHEHHGIYAGYHSNEHEMVFLDSYPSLKPQNLDFAKGTLTHEFQHLLHWGQDENESTWVDEGCADFAMWLCGFPPEGGDYSHVGYFIKSPSTSLTYWDYSDPFANYGAAYLWTMYCYEQFGGRDFLTSLTAESRNGIRGVNNTLEDLGFKDDFNSVFADWTVTNFLDLADTVSFGGKYSYRGTNLEEYNYNRGIVPGRSASSHPASGTVSIPNWSAEYIKFTQIPDQSYAFGLESASGDSFGAKIITREQGDIHSVLDMSAEETGDPEISLFAFGMLYDDVIMVPSLRVEHYAQSEYSAAVTYYSSADVDSVIPPPPPPDGEPWESDSLNLAVHQNPYYFDKLSVTAISVFKPDENGITMTALPGGAAPDTLDAALIDTFEVYGGIFAWRYAAPYTIPGSGNLVMRASFTDSGSVFREIEREYTAFLAAPGGSACFTSPDGLCSFSIPPGAVRRPVWLLLSEEPVEKPNNGPGAALSLIPGGNGKPIDGLPSITGVRYKIGPAGLEFHIPAAIELICGPPPAPDFQPWIQFSQRGLDWVDLDVSYTTESGAARFQIDEAGVLKASWSGDASSAPPSIPGELGLNYPNPFNPVTIIPVTISGGEHGEAVESTLSIYDLAGRLVVELHRGLLEQGRHVFTWRADGTASGLYFARLEISGSQAATRSMVLLK